METTNPNYDNFSQALELGNFEDAISLLVDPIISKNQKQLTEDLIALKKEIISSNSSEFRNVLDSTIGKLEIVETKLFQNSYDLKAASEKMASVELLLAQIDSERAKTQRKQTKLLNYLFGLNLLGFGLLYFVQ